MAVPFLLPGTAPPVKRQAPAGCGLPELAMIKYFSAVYAQSVSGGHFKLFSHHKEHNGIGWRTTQRGRNGGMEGRKRIAVVGSDARQAAAGRALARAGYAVAGAEQVARADVILLPLPLDESRTPLAQLLRAAKPGAFALGGRLSAQAVEIARQAGMSRREVAAALESVVEPISLEEPVYTDGGDAMYVIDQVRDPDGEDSWISGLQFRQTVAGLTPREKKIMELRYLKGKTQMEVAKEIGISQAQVSRLEKAALGQFRTGEK